MRRGSKYYCRLRKAEEAMLAAVSTYNNPLVTFKTETCISLIVTAWTYMLQAYCIENRIEIRIRDTSSKRLRYRKSRDDGTYLTVPFPDLVGKCDAILSTGMRNNLLFINGIRRGVHHSVDNSIDGFAAPKIQANILNFNEVLREISKGKIDVASKLPLALQFAEMSFNQASKLITANHLNPELQTFILKFEHELTDEERNDTAYEAHIRFQVENKNRGKDLYSLSIVEPGDDIPEGVSTVAIKEVEKPKYRPSEVVKMMKDEGYTQFSIPLHTDLWHSVPGSKNESSGYGKLVSNQWYWYQKWINEQVRPFCERGYVL